MVKTKAEVLEALQANISKSTMSATLVKNLEGTSDQDVDEARQKLNFSDWSRFREADDIHRVVRGGEMPPSQFLIMHPEAKLAQAEKDALVNGLQATVFGQ